MSLLAGGLLMVQALTSPWAQCEVDRDKPQAERRVDVGAALRADSLADVLARRFAPVLSFAPGERFFPTIPFFMAFDGDPLGGDSLKADFEDPWEVAPYLRDTANKAIDSLHVSWNELLENYHHVSGKPGNREHAGLERGLRRVVVLYRVCALAPEQNQNLVRFLKSDEQAFERFEEVRRLDVVLGTEDPEFDVIQYFLYYLADRGLQGHPNDIELVSVFFPREPGRLDQFRIVVGSGHSSRNPNNVQVLSAYHRGEDELPGNPFVMVELGGHSSAPDLPPFGRFTPGLDANWHAYDVWGTRDAQAAGGLGYIGRYAQAMTFDRGFGSDGIYVFPPRYDAAQARSTEQEIKGRPDSADKSTPTRQEPDTMPHRYRLLPVQLLFRLDSALATANRNAIGSAISTIQRRLCPRRAGNARWCDGPDSMTWNSRDFSGQTDTVAQDAAIQAMRRWRNDLLITGTGESRLWAAGTHRPWEHQSFRGKCDGGNPCEGQADPTEVFKAHLFRPNTYTVRLDGGLRNLLLLGMTAAPTDGYELYTGIVVPAFRSRALPVRLGGFLELHVGVNCGWRCRELSPTFGILHEGHRNSYVSWYVTGSWVPRRPEVTGIPGAGKFSIGGGASVLPKLWPNTFRIMNAIRIRTGIRFDPFLGKDLLGRVRWELHFAVRQ